MNIPDTDREFDEMPLEGVRREGKGYVLTRDGFSLSIDDPGFEPKVGMTARYYGRGIGYVVRGVMIDGKACRYQTPEQLAEEQRTQSDQFERERQDRTAAVEASGRTEKAMRQESAPWPKTIEELTTYIQKQVEGPHDYGTRVYAMSLSATAAFHFVAGQLGATGFQASCADLDILRRTRQIEGPFILLKAEDALYPQCDLTDKLDKAMAEWQPWLAKEAQQKLDSSASAHPNVKKHWRRLVAKKE